MLYFGPHYILHTVFWIQKTMLHSIIVANYWTLFSALYLYIYEYLLCFITSHYYLYYTLYYYVYAIVVYYCIFQAMYGPSLINYCLLSNFIRVMRPTLNGGIWILAGSTICYWERNVCSNIKIFTNGWSEIKNIWLIFKLKFFTLALQGIKYTQTKNDCNNHNCCDGYNLS